jgi:hypothetical protein
MHTLTWDEEFKLRDLVLRSITSRYQGELECSEWGHKGEVAYTPLDTGDIHDIAVELWGERLTRDWLSDLEQQLCEDGADREEWNPKNYCDEEEEEERERQLLCDDAYRHWCR